MGDCQHKVGPAAGHDAETVPGVGVSLGAADHAREPLPRGGGRLSGVALHHDPRARVVRRGLRGPVEVASAGRLVRDDEHHATKKKTRRRRRRRRECTTTTTIREG